MHDLFICHATPDKKLVVEPIVAECQRQGVSYWLDQDSLPWGADMAEAIARGVQQSRLVLVVVSQNAIDRGWPAKEISQALQREAESREVIVLPLCVGDRDDLVKSFPQLSGKLWRQWANNPAELVDEIRQILGKPTIASSKAGPGPESVEPYLPSLRQPYTDHDRDQFIQVAFKTITEYFELAARHLSEREARVKFNAQQVDSEKFKLTIYLDGKTRCQCEVWIDAMQRRYPAINYLEGTGLSGKFSSYNESLNIVESQLQMRLKGTLGNMFGDPINASTPQEAAEALWKRFVRPLEARG